MGVEARPRSLRARRRIAFAPFLIAALLQPTWGRAQPANDSFVAAVVVPGAGSITASTVGATKEAGEPAHAGDPGGASLWYRWTPPESGSATFDTSGSDFDTLLAVYTGDAVTALTPVASNDDDPALGTAGRVVLDAQAEIAYHIAIDGKAGATGTAILNLTTDVPTCDVLGTSGHDELMANDDGQGLCGLAGNDLILDGDGDDAIYGGSGNDLLLGRAGADVVDGGPGNDEVSGREGPDVVRGDDGDDRLYPGPGSDAVDGGPGRDTASYVSNGGSVSIDLAFGRARGNGVDILVGIEDATGSPRADVIRGTKRGERLTGGGGADYISGLAGNDGIEGGGSDDSLFAGTGRDRVKGGPGTDTCFPRACERRAPFDDWLPVINAYRGIADLPRLMENIAYSAGDRLHARYMVKTDQGGHTEDPDSPYYTKAGAIAAGNSNVFFSTTTALPDRRPIDFWISGPFHAIGLLRPGLAEVGYGVYRDASSPGLRMGAALDVLRGIEAPAAGADLPVFFPGDDSRIGLTSYGGNEFPDPLTPCPGYRAPTGLPLLVMRDSETRVRSHSLMRGTAKVEHCVYTGKSYRNPDASAEGLGRAVLGNTIVLVPRAPLRPGAKYNASIRTTGERFEWSFTVRG